MHDEAYLPPAPGVGHGGTPYGIEAQHLQDPSDNLGVVRELFNEPATPEAELEHHIKILTSDTPVVGQQVKQAAMLLHTDVYLKNGIISERDVNADGLYVDDYSARARYYLVRNGQKVATARQIACDKKEGILSLPTARNFSVDPDVLAEVAGVSSVASIKPEEAVEISALASEKLERGTATNFDAVMALYSSMLHTSLESGHKLWMMNVEPGFIRRLQFMVGPGQVHVLGEARAYQGAPTIPVAVNPQEIVRQVLTSNQPHSDVYKAHMRTVLAGISDRKIPKDIRYLLAENDIAVKKYPAIARLVTNPQVIAQTAIMAYSAARAFPAGGVKEFNGQVWALWGIDVATSMPYVYGLTKMYTAQTLGGKAVGAAVAIPSFLAPYIYFYAESGKNYPMYVNGVVAAFIGTAVLKEAIGRTMRARKEAKIRDGLVRLPVSGMH